MNFKALTEYWESQGIGHAFGASRSEIARFESKHGVKLPKDIRQYFLEVNGFSKLSAKENDDRGFRFLSMSAVNDAQESLEELTGEYPELPKLGKLFVFAEFLQWSWGYAISLNKDSRQETPIVPIGKFSYPIISRSFGEFIDLYLENDARIYAG